MDRSTTSGRLPAHCLEWLASSRLRFLDDLLQGNPMRYFSAHLPVMATWTDGTGEEPDTFPVNMTVKGIGLIPRESLIADFTDVFESTIAEARTMPWDKSLQMRVEAVKLLYANNANFDPAMLGGLEIFEGKAFANIQENPSASLLYVGMTHGPEGPQYISFQVNGNVEILEKQSPHYRFLLASRKLFEFDAFHVFQADYPFGYLIRIAETRNKSPWSRGKTDSA
jgi:hypothetical protein